MTFYFCKQYCINCLYWDLNFDILHKIYHLMLFYDNYFNRTLPITHEIVKNFWQDIKYCRNILQMPVKLLYVVFLIEDSGHVGAHVLTWHLATADPSVHWGDTHVVTRLSLGPEIQRKVNNSLLAVQILLLKWNKTNITDKAATLWRMLYFPW